MLMVYTLVYDNCISFSTKISITKIRLELFVSASCFPTSLIIHCKIIIICGGLIFMIIVYRIIQQIENPTKLNFVCYKIIFHHITCILLFSNIDNPWIKFPMKMSFVTKLQKFMPHKIKWISIIRFQNVYMNDKPASEYPSYIPHPLKLQGVVLGRIQPGSSRNDW
jgi:hypothetical protein